MLPTDALLLALACLDADLCRHPMYGGLVLVAAGLTLATGNEVRLVMSLIAFFVLNEKVIVKGGGKGGRGSVHEKVREPVGVVVCFE